MVMGGLVVAAKVAGLVASTYVAWETWRTMPESETRRKMLRMFKDGELYKKKKKATKGKELLIYPTINRVSTFQDCVQIVFTLPDGLNPQDVASRGWLFKQVFGENIEISGSVKTFTLNVYRQDVVSFDYDFDDVQKTIKDMRLPVYVGRSRTGDEAYDMTEHPHLLVAGETGSGKSVALRSIITTLIKTAGDRLELYCADLKRSEFHLFRDVAVEVMNESPQLHKTLLSLRKEMKKRGDLLDKAGLANVNDLPESSRPKYIVLAIDEVALLKKEKELMEIVEEISAIGRALGVFLILSMQRPDADVLDGKLKNNLTVRMAFRHADEINSRITIGTGEAAEIKQSQKGRMVLKFDGLKFVQGPHLDIPNARALLEPHKRPPQLAKQKKVKEVEDDDTFELGVL